MDHDSVDLRPFHRTNSLTEATFQVTSYTGLSVLELRYVSCAYETGTARGQGIRSRHEKGNSMPTWPFRVETTILRGDRRI